MNNLNVLIFNGSPRANGNTKTAIDEMVKVFDAEKISSEIIDVGKMTVRGCIGCYSCQQTGKCVFDDEVNELAEKLEKADGVVLASPVYYASANGSLISLLDRLFFSSSCDKTMKVGAAIACARRAGTTATLDVLNKYIMYGGFAVASSQYWNMIHGAAPGECVKDEEGMQTIRILAKNMIFLMKSIALGKEQYGLPEKETKLRTNFIS